jgi:hypothetical protein
MCAGDEPHRAHVRRHLVEREPPVHLSVGVRALFGRILVPHGLLRRGLLAEDHVVVVPVLHVRVSQLRHVRQALDAPRHPLAEDDRVERLGALSGLPGERGAKQITRILFLLCP